MHANDANAQGAQADLTTAYNNAAGQASNASVGAALGGCDAGASSVGLPVVGSDVGSSPLSAGPSMDQEGAVATDDSCCGNAHLAPNFDRSTNCAQRAGCCRSVEIHVQINGRAR